MINPLLFLVIFSGIFLVGFISNLFFKKTKISDIFILILIGLLLGPIFNVIPQTTIFLLRQYTPVFAAVALIVLIFDGGLYLNFYKVITEIKNAFLFTMLTFLLTSVLSSVLLHYVFGFDWIFGLLLGVIIGGTSSEIIIPLVTKSSASDKTKTIMTLESAITDVLCVVATVTIVGIIVSQIASTKQIVQGVFSAFALAAVIGLIGGITWSRILRDSSDVKGFSYFLTLSFLFLLYAMTEYLSGNGAFCVLIFGLVLGNASDIFKTFKMKDFILEKTIHHFQTEISLVIKTFFFIYLGVIIEFKYITFDVILITLAIVVLIIILRILITKLLFRKNLIKLDRDLMVALHTRGLAAAVLATYPLSMGVDNVFTQKIIGVAFLLIILTNVTTTVYFFIIEKKNKNNLTKGRNK
ncbi:MAG: cation:proton antiporter [Candidatus ainarchaeum sp.]|nr:cation:proton antiporter [Candidatus ainarchaeum sp.]